MSFITLLQSHSADILEYLSKVPHDQVFDIMEIIGNNALFCNDLHYQWVAHRLLTLDSTKLTPEQWNIITLFDITLIPDGYIVKREYLESCIRKNYIHQLMALRSKFINNDEVFSVIRNHLLELSDTFMSIEMSNIIKTIKN